MGLYLYLAWRNLWRNKRRTLISTSSVFFAVLLSLIMRSMQNGTYDFMIESSVGLFSGYIQIHGKGYWEKRSLDQSMDVSDDRIVSVASTPGVTRLTPRLEFFSLISRDSSTKVTQVIGIDPEKENGMTGLAARIRKGRYLRKDDSGILLCSGLAKYLKAGIGDSVVIYGQGFHGVTAAARIPVVGILGFPIPEIDNSTSYLPLKYAQWLLNAPDRLTSIAIMVDNPSAMNEVQSRLEQIADKGMEVMNWKEMMPELVQSIQADSSGGILMLMILYIVIGFGIFGTIMMMVNERLREFGVLISVGMKRWKLTAVTVLETIMISLLGAGTGTAFAVPLLWYLHLHPVTLTGDYAQAMLAYGLEPILPFSVESGIFFAQSLIVLLLALTCSVYPFLVIRKLKPIAALRS
jgi:ABC-type lipoprotein release transport system permease subunit